MLRCLLDLRHARVMAMVLLMAVAPASGGLAQTVTDGVAKKPPTPSSRHAPKSTLIAGPVRVKFANAQHGAVYSAGDSAFVEVRVRSSSRRRRGVRSAQLAFVSHGGRIRAVSGRYVRTRREGDTVIAEVRKLHRNKDRTLLVEVRMIGSQGAARKKVENTLQVTLQQPKAKKAQMTTFRWTVEMCAAGYHQALAELRRGPVDTLLPALRSLRRRDVALPGRWLFWKYSRRSRGPGRACKRWRRYRVVRNDRVRIVRRCTRWVVKRKPKLVGVSLAEPKKEEVKLMRFVGAFVADRGAPSEFARDGRFGWVSQRVMYDLRTYTGQPPHPALCSGAPEMLNYFSRRLVQLRRRHNEVAAIQKDAVRLLQARLAAAYEIRKANPVEMPPVEPVQPIDAPPATGRTPAAEPAGARPPALRAKEAPLPVAAPARAPARRLPAPQPPAENASPAALVAYLVGLVRPAADLGEIESETDPIAALKIAKDLLEPKKNTHVPKHVMQATKSALRMAETAVYVQRLQQRYQQFVTPLFSSLGAIRTSHEKMCACGQ